MIDEIAVWRQEPGDETYRVQIEESTAQDLGYQTEIDERYAEAGLLNLVVKCKAKADKYQQSVLESMNWESRGLTYREVDKILTGQTHRKVSKEPYVAAEDLTFMYLALHKLWSFINQATFLIAYPEQTEF
jgi:hypothetical protein